MENEQYYINQLEHASRVVDSLEEEKRQLDDRIRYAQRMLDIARDELKDCRKEG